MGEGRSTLMKELTTKKVRKGGTKKHENGRHRNMKNDATHLSRSSRTLGKKRSSGPSECSKSQSFLEKMRARLSGGHFRMINEKLYSCTGVEALAYFKDDPSLFQMYHSGYQEQMSHWPEQPVEIIAKWLNEQTHDLLVADFGCGDARLAKSVKNNVFSFDLVASDPSVTVCDMSNTPLSNSSVDVAVFCLSLMGTNYGKYIEEAHRVLKPSGWLLIAEIRSRFDHSNGGADSEHFIKAICNLGFSMTLKDFSNKMFFILHFQKEKRCLGKKDVHWPELKACLYKRR